MLKKIVVAMSLLLLACAPPPRSSGDVCFAKTLEDLEFASTSTCFEVIVYETTLTSLDGLGDSTGRIGRVALGNNSSLIDVSSLSSLQHPLVFDVTETPLAPDLDLPTSVTELNLQKTSVARLTGPAKTMDEIRIGQNGALRSVDFDNLETLRGLVIEGNPELADVLLPSLSSLASLTITDNPLLPVASFVILADAVGVEQFLHCGNADDDPCE